jgi:hypothetical protein
MRVEEMRRCAVFSELIVNLNVNKNGSHSQCMVSGAACQWLSG